MTAISLDGAITTFYDVPMKPAKRKPERWFPQLGFGNPTESEAIDRSAQEKSWHKSCAGLSQAGVHLFFPHVELTDCWIDLDRYDFRLIDDMVSRTLNVDAGARFILRLRLHVPPWWHDKRPGQNIRYDDGSESLDTHWVKNVHPVSLASTVWQQDAEDLFRKAIEHVESSGYSVRIAGYNPALLHGGEWFEEGSMYHKLADYSQTMQSAFRDWLRKKYPDQEIPEQCVPSPEDRFDGEIGNLRDPLKNRRVIDYFLFYHDLFASQAEGICRVIKESSKGRALVGIYYGYTLVLSGVDGQPGWVQNSGHLALRRILNSPYIDFLSSMLEYSHRKPGEFCWSFGPLADSCRVHGKFYIGEDEIRTWLNKTDPGVFYYIDQLESPDDVANIMLRNIACMLSHRSWEELADLGGGWYRHPEVLESIGKTAQFVANTAPPQDAVSEIALFVDETSLMYQSIREADHLNKPLLIDSLVDFFHIGAPIDIYLFSDLTDGRIPLGRYRFLVFLNAFYLDADQRAYIREMAACEDRCILNYYAAGFIGPDGLSEKGIQALTGIRIRFDTRSSPLRVSVNGREYGTQKTVSPVFYVDDPEAEIIGELVRNSRGRSKGDHDRNNHGKKGGLCLKRFEGWTSIYSAAPCIPAEILRRFARDAGVHLYVQSDDLIHATSGFLAIHAGFGGTKRITLPGKTDVVDPWTEDRDYAAVSEFSAAMRKGETRVWLTRPPAGSP